MRTSGAAEAGSALRHHLPDGGRRSDLLAGYLGAAALLVAAALAETRLGVDAENRPLESIAPPPSAEERDHPTPQPPARAGCG